MDVRRLLNHVGWTVLMGVFMASPPGMPRRALHGVRTARRANAARYSKGHYGQSAVAAGPHLVPFTGQVQHIFFHPLVIYPNLAFGGSEAQGYQDWFVTVAEFERMLPQLYANNYILVNVHDLYAVQYIQGRAVVRPKVLLVPPGKKPLILSIDDLNYYDYMRRNGNAYRLVLTKGGQIATYSVDPAGQVVVSRDNEIIPLLDQFVAAHPGFSLDGAKGIINETGYEGVLGYRTQPGSPDRAQQIREVLPIIARLKRDGWVFACHSWGHRDDATIPYGDLVWDTEQWKQQVEPLLGSTDLYVYPFGADVRSGGAKMRYLIGQGFHFFFGVGPQPYWRWGPGYVAMDRVHVDGMALMTQAGILAPFFNARTVIDLGARGLGPPALAFAGNAGRAAL